MGIHKLPVDEYTTPAPLTVEATVSITELMSIMETEKFRHIPVVDAGKAVGIISDRDLRMFTALGGGDHIIARDIMVSHPFIVKSGTALEDVAFSMSKNKLGSAIVVDPEDNVVGIFTSTDALNALIEVLRGDVDA